MAAAFILVLVVLGCLSNACALKCYMCKDVTENRFCNETNQIVDCGNDQDGQRYDTCMADIKYEYGKGLTITKKCVIGPCHFGDARDRSIGLDHDCDKSNDKWHCVECCDTNGCNKSTGSHLRACAGVGGLLLVVVYIAGRLRETM